MSLLVSQQDSILGPVLFNIYVNDLSDCLGTVKSLQYTDDTTMYLHSKPSNLSDSQVQLQQAIDNLSTRSADNNLCLNPTKTKVILFSTQQLARAHGLDEYSMNLRANDTNWDRVKSSKLLRTELHQNLKWNNDVLSKVASCCSTLSVIRNVKNFAPFHIRKQLVECLVISRLNYNDVVYHQLPNYLTHCLKLVQLAAASFVFNRFSSTSDLLKLGWLLKYHRDLSL